MICHCTVEVSSAPWSGVVKTVLYDLKKLLIHLLEDETTITIVFHLIATKTSLNKSDFICEYSFYFCLSAIAHVRFCLHSV
jgi:hypothetical protein